MMIPILDSNLILDSIAAKKQKNSVLVKFLVMIILMLFALVERH